MRFALALLLACTGAPDTDEEPVETDVVEDSDPLDTDGECRLEGESCTRAGPEDFNGDCCNGRHTCFAEGCFYSLPPG